MVVKDSIPDIRKVTRTVFLDILEPSLVITTSPVPQRAHLQSGDVKNALLQVCSEAEAIPIRSQDTAVSSTVACVPLLLDSPPPHLQEFASWHLQLKSLGRLIPQGIGVGRCCRFISVAVIKCPDNKQVRAGRAYFLSPFQVKVRRLGEITEDGA